MKDDYGDLLRSVVLRDVMDGQNSVEQRRNKFAQSIVKARQKVQKRGASNAAVSKNLDKRANAMRSVFEATRSKSAVKPNTKPSNQPRAQQRSKPSTKSRSPPRPPPNTRLKISEEELRMHMTDLFTRRVPEKKEVPSGKGLSLIFRQDLQQGAPKAKKLDIFERKRRMRDVNAVWSLLEQIKAKVRDTHRTLSLRLNSPLKGLHQEVLSELSLAHNSKIHARRDTK